VNPKGVATLKQSLCSLGVQMPTLFRLLSVVGIAVGLAYGAMYAVVVLFQPQPRAIVEAVALPQSAEMHTGRSAAETLNTQARALVYHDRRWHNPI